MYCSGSRDKTGQAGSWLHGYEKMQRGHTMPTEDKGDKVGEQFYKVYKRF
jgi:hypothetical protein